MFAMLPRSSFHGERKLEIRITAAIEPGKSMIVTTPFLRPILGGYRFAIAGRRP